jgi:thiosulfate/3-mercaptopyruvate sulfurtransferase
LEAWEKVFISDAKFVDSIHGSQGCIACHGGTSGATDKDAAHQGVVNDPDSAEVCGACHSAIVKADANSLHTTLAGYTTVLEARGSASTMPQIEEMRANHCNSCHTTCGQCHVSRPTTVGGGLSAGHEFKKIPPMNQSCTGCHGSRIEDEYKGKNEGVKADVHWVPGGNSCFTCHSEDQMHGVSDGGDTRYAGAQNPACTECHDVKAGEGSILHTADHLETMSCQVCHSTTYKNCYSCHVAQKDGTRYYKIEDSVMSFKIGLNTLQSKDRPWKYVVVRHAPVDPDSFDYYGDNLMPNFSAVPTWKYATPHNIQRKTSQTVTCNSCHGNTELFLTAADLLPYEVEANQSVIVTEIPAKR